MDKKKITIKIAADITGLTIKSIRYYEKIGLIKPSSYSDSGYRLYSNEDIYRLQQIQFYKELQFPLQTITEILSSSEKVCTDLFQKQLLSIQKRIEQYQRIESILQASLYEENLELKKENANVVVIGLDLQNDIKEGGALPCKRFYTLLDPLTHLYKKMRKNKIPIIYVCDCHKKGEDKELEIWPDHMIEGTYGAEVVEELTPEKEDVVLKKSFFNGFVQTDLQKTLYELKAKTIIFTGWRTHMCVAQTAIEAFHRNYRVIIAKDGVNSTTQKEHEFGLQLMDVNYGFEMYHCEELIQMIEKKEIL